MPFTVRDLFSIDIMQSAVLVAGEQGLDNPVSFVNIMETPEVAKFMKGGEFLISAGFALSEEETACRRLIREFAQKGIAAFGINVGRYLHAIPAAMIDEANQQNLPLLILPKNVPYMDIMTAVWDKTVNQRVQSAESKNFYNVLLDVILSERGIVGISNTLSMLIGNPVFLLDANHCLLSASAQPVDLDRQGTPALTDLTAFIKQSQADGSLKIEAKPQRLLYPMAAAAPGLPLLVMPILVNSTLNGYLFILEQQKELDQDDILALSDTGTIIALEMLKEKAVLDVQRRTQSELLEDLLSGYYRDTEALARHLKGLRFTVGAPMAMLFLELAPASGSLPYDFKSRLMRALEDYAEGYLQGALTASRSNCIICLLALKPETTLQELTGLTSHLQTRVGNQGIKAVGGSNIFPDVSGARKAYAEAKLAAKAAPPGQGLSLSFYQKMGVYLLLNEIKDLPAARSFYHLYLQALVEYDQHDGELIKTLEAYFACNGNLRKTADQLFVHKNSVIYRLNKIRQLTGLDVNDSNHRFNLELGLYLLRLDRLS